MFALQTQYVLKQPSETWDGKPRRILPTLRVSPTYVFLHRTLAIEPTHSIQRRRTRRRVIYAESASDLTTHKLKFTHQPGSFNLMATKNLPKALEIRCFGIGEYDSYIAKGCLWNEWQWPPRLWGLYLDMKTKLHFQTLNQIQFYRQRLFGYRSWRRGEGIRRRRKVGRRGKGLGLVEELHRSLEQWQFTVPPSFREKD